MEIYSKPPLPEYNHTITGTVLPKGEKFVLMHQQFTPYQLSLSIELLLVLALLMGNGTDQKVFNSLSCDSKFLPDRAMFPIGATETE